MEYQSYRVTADHNISDKQGCARDLLSRDRDETRDPCLQDREEIEAFKILFEIDRDETFKIRDDIERRRDVAASEMLAETLKLPRLSRV